MRAVIRCQPDAEVEQPFSCNAIVTSKLGKICSMVAQIVPSFCFVIGSSHDPWLSRPAPNS